MSWQYTQERMERMEEDMEVAREESYLGSTKESIEYDTDCELRALQPDYESQDREMLENEMVLAPADMSRRRLKNAISWHKNLAQIKKEKEMEQQSIAVRQSQEVDFTNREVIDTIKQTVAKGASDAELAQFIQVCQGTGLNPFLKEIWYIPATKTIMAGRDGFLRKANENPQFDGMESKVERDKNNIPVKAVCTVWRKDRSHPITCEAYYDEYKKQSPVWKQYPSAMIMKVAEVLALKRSFAINGVVTEEEIGEAPKAEEVRAVMEEDTQEAPPDDIHEPWDEEEPKKKDRPPLVPEIAIVEHRVKFRDLVIEANQLTKRPEDNICRWALDDKSITMEGLNAITDIREFEKANDKLSKYIEKKRAE